MSANVNHSLPLEYQTEQNRLNILGFWIFLGAEIVLFATLFAVYGVLVTAMPVAQRQAIFLN